jgi:uncharacterized protein YndB with AHSA1/START domain
MLAQTKSPDFVISRVLHAPRDLVWQCCTEPERMNAWWGPKGFTVVDAKMDLRPGGIYHYGMRPPEGHTMWGKFVYREIAAPERLVFVNMFSDEAGGITRHPLSPTWPLQMLSTFTFEELPGGQTNFTIRWSPLNASPEEQQTFDAGHASMQQGWGGTLDRLSAYLLAAK